MREKKQPKATPKPTSKESNEMSRTNTGRTTRMTERQANEARKARSIDAFEKGADILLKIAAALGANRELNIQHVIAKTGEAWDLMQLSELLDVQVTHTCPKCGWNSAKHEYGPAEDETWPPSPSDDDDMEMYYAREDRYNEPTEMEM